MRAYTQLLERLYTRAKARMSKYDLDTMRSIGERLWPTGALPPIVTVAGTNGKGSTAVALAHALRNALVADKADAKVGLYTSPHLVRLGERIQINREAIAEEDLLACFSAVEAVSEDSPRPPTFFETLTLMAMWHFVAQGCDAVVLEVGLGGRLDATNAFDPEVAVITNIGLDHQELLGDTIRSIALEKAGIMRSGRPAVLGPQSSAEARATLVEYASKLGADMCVVDGLPGEPVRKRNERSAAAAYEAWAELHSVARGFDPSGPVWPGRLQRIGGWVLDGAHNPQAVDALLRNLAEEGGVPSKILFSGLGSKDMEPMLAALVAEGRDIQLCFMDIWRAASEEELSALARRMNLPEPVSLDDAFRRGKQWVDKGEQVLVTGSLFLVGEVLARIQKLSRDPAIAS